MRDKYESQLKDLKNLMIQMGTLIENAISEATRALITKDEEKAKQIVANDDAIDEIQREIEGLCFKILMQQQPVASDLRMVSAAMKMVTDMERIGDHASDISEIVLLLAKEEYVSKLEHIQQMAVETTAMVIDSVQAYVDNDAVKPLDVIKKDDKVDELFMDAKHDLIEMISEDKKCGEQATDLLMIAKYFERIGDHAVNIAEWVIYSITGEHK